MVLGIYIWENFHKDSKPPIIVEPLEERLFSSSEYKRIGIYPNSRFVEIKQGDIGGFTLGIKNNLEKQGSTSVFSYEVSISDPEFRWKCNNITTEEAENWIVTGKEEKNIKLSSGDFTSEKVLFDIPVYSHLCTFRCRVDVKVDGNHYATDFFDIKIIPN